MPQNSEWSVGPGRSLGIALFLGLTALLSVWLIPPALLAIALIGTIVWWLLGVPSRWIAVLTWALPFHTTAMALLFGWFGLPSAVVRVLASWKELSVVALLAVTLLRVIQGRGARTSVTGTDLAVGSLCALSAGFAIASGVLAGPELPVLARIYGFRDVALFLLLYFVGRATPSLGDDDRVISRLFLVGVATSVIALLERLLVGPEALVALGFALYFQDFLGVAAFTTGNDFGLPHNYWSFIGGREFRRTGSVYLSSQGFAVTFLLIIPAATTWLVERQTRTVRWAWLGYVAIWMGLLLTVTRMTIVVCLAQVILLAMLLGRVRVVAGMAAGGALTLMGALIAVPGLAGFAWDTLTWQTGSSATHLEDWGRGLSALAAHPLGSGLGTADQTAVRAGLDPLTADNQFLKYAVELGIPGLLLLVMLLGGTAGAALRVFRAGPVPHHRRLGLTVLVATVGISANAMTATLFSSMLLSYVYFWLAGTVVTLSQRLGVASPARTR